MLAKEQYASKEATNEQYSSKEPAKEAASNFKQLASSKEVDKDSVSKEPNKKYARLSSGARPHEPPFTHRLPESSNVSARSGGGVYQLPICYIQSQDGYLLRQYPILWRGPLALKSAFVSVQMHFVSGSSTIARASLPAIAESGTAVIRIAQRMRLETAQLDAVYRKIQLVDKHSILLALPFGRDQVDLIEQSNNLKFKFIHYLFAKEAAGIINVTDDAQQPTFVIHIFPACDFIDNNLSRIAPTLLHLLKEYAYLVIIIVEV